MKKFIAYSLLLVVITLHLPKSILHDCRHLSEEVQFDSSKKNMPVIEQGTCEICSIDLFHYGPLEIPFELGVRKVSQSTRTFLYEGIKLISVQDLDLRGPPMS